MNRLNSKTSMSTNRCDRPSPMLRRIPAGWQWRETNRNSTTAEGRVQVEFQGKVRLTTLGTHDVGPHKRRSVDRSAQWSYRRVTGN